MTDQGAKATPDWEKIEADYRAGVLSVREMAAAAGVSHTAIQKRAKAQGWERDISAKVSAKADSLVAKRQVATEVATEKAISERQLIEASAQVIADVRMAHRGDIRKARDLTMLLLNELESTTLNNHLFAELGEMLRCPDEKGQDKLNDLYHKVIGLPSRVGSIKQLADALKTLVTLEREAYGISTNEQEGKGNVPKGLGHFYGQGDS